MPEPEDKKPQRMKPRTAQKDIVFEFVYCACRDCRLRFFFGAFLARRHVYGDHCSSREAKSAKECLAGLVECPRCGYVGAQLTGFSCTETDNPKCNHPHDRLVAEIHRGQFAAVCLDCGSRRFGFDTRYRGYNDASDAVKRAMIEDVLQVYEYEKRFRK